MGHCNPGFNTLLLSPLGSSRAEPRQSTPSPGTSEFVDKEWKDKNCLPSFRFTVPSTDRAQLNCKTLLKVPAAVPQIPQSIESTLVFTRSPFSQLLRQREGHVLGGFSRPWGSRLVGFEDQRSPGGSNVRCNRSRANQHGGVRFEWTRSKCTVAFSVTQRVNQVSPGKKVWLGETSSAYGGGALGLSDTFAAGFMWVFSWAKVNFKPASFTTWSLPITGNKVLFKGSVIHQSNSFDNWPDECEYLLSFFCFFWLGHTFKTS